MEKLTSSCRTTASHKTIDKGRQASREKRNYNSNCRVDQNIACGLDLFRVSSCSEILICGDHCKNNRQDYQEDEKPTVYYYADKACERWQVCEGPRCC